MSLTLDEIQALTKDFWYPGAGLFTQAIVAPDGKSGRFGASSVSTSSIFWLVMPDIVQGNIIVTVYSGPASLTITPNNTPNAFGNTVYYDGTQAVTDLEATPEPMTIALLGLGGLFLLRRRQN